MKYYLPFIHRDTPTFAGTIVRLSSINLRKKVLKIHFFKKINFLTAEDFQLCIRTQANIFKILSKKVKKLSIRPNGN